MSNSLDQFETLANGFADAVELPALRPSWCLRRRRMPSTGIAYAADLVITANHAVEREDDVKIGLADGRSVDATLAGRDPARNIALLRLKEGVLTPAQTAKNAPRIGQLVLQLHDRALQADQRPGRVQRPGHHGQGRPRHQGRRRPHVPEHQAVHDDDGAGERPGRPALPHARAHHRLDHPHAVRAPRGARDRGARARAARTSWASRAATRIWPSACPTATSGGWRSRARWPRIRSCCCSTSRRRA